MEAAEIEITDEMVEAGFEVFRLQLPDAQEAMTDEDSADFVRRLMLAMLAKVEGGADLV